MCQCLWCLGQCLAHGEDFKDSHSGLSLVSFLCVRLHACVMTLPGSLISGRVVVGYQACKFPLSVDTSLEPL